FLAHPEPASAPLVRRRLRALERLEVSCVGHIPLDVPFIGPVVLRQGANERVGSLLLEYVRRPTGDSGGDEERGKGRGVETHEVVGWPGWTDQVGVDALTRDELVLERLVHLRHVVTTVVLDQRVKRLLHRRHARVPTLVHAVTEAHDLTLLGE